MRKPFWACVRIEDTNGFLGILQYHQRVQISEEVLREEVFFPREVMTVTLKIPYAWTISREMFR